MTEPYGGNLYAYDAWPSGEPYAWPDGGRLHADDLVDFHVDIGCGKLKKGRIGVDRFAAPGVNVICDLDGLETYAVAAAPGRDAEFDYDPTPGARQPLVTRGLPFADESIESMVSHHALEHVDQGFLALMEECWRVLKPGAKFRIVVPLFPSTAAVEDPDHKRYFMENTFESLEGPRDESWLASFSVPYTRAGWRIVNKDFTALLPPHQRWTVDDRRELRVTLRKGFHA